MNDKLRDILARLSGVSKTGDQWEALCPAHDDSNPSLHVSVGRSQPVVLNCKAGCRTDEVLRALGLEWDAVLTDDQAADKPPLSKRIESSDWKLFPTETTIYDELLELERAWEYMTPEEMARFKALGSMLRARYFVRANYKILPFEICDCGCATVLDTHPKAPHREEVFEVERPRPPRQVTLKAHQRAEDRKRLLSIQDDIVGRALDRARTDQELGAEIDLELGPSDELELLF